jgi:hypothetical protein
MNLQTAWSKTSLARMVLEEWRMVENTLAEQAIQSIGKTGAGEGI